MTTPSQAHGAGAHAHEGHANRFPLFVWIALILGIVTAVEIGVLFMPIINPVRIAMLVTLSIVKFMMVIFIFMHLKWDRVFCTILFFIGLSLAAGTITTLIAVFRVKDSVPLTSHASMAEPVLRAAASQPA